jgi:hypothetical protein
VQPAVVARTPVGLTVAVRYTNLGEEVACGSSEVEPFKVADIR